MSIQISGPVVLPDGSVTAAKISSGAAPDGQVLTADGAGGAAWAAVGGGGPGYLEYVALLTQTGTNAPVATVLKNTLGGPVVWTYMSVGLYQAALVGAFPMTKTALLWTHRQQQAPPALSNLAQSGDGDTLQLSTWLIDKNMESFPDNGLLYYSLIEIRVYP